MSDSATPPYCFIKETVYERQFYYLENLCFLVWFFFSSLTLNTVLLVTVTLSFNLIQMWSFTATFSWDNFLPFHLFQMQANKRYYFNAKSKTQEPQRKPFPVSGQFAVLQLCKERKKEIGPSSAIINQTRQNLHVCITGNICTESKTCLGTPPLRRREVSQHFDSLYNYKVKRKLLMWRLDRFHVCNPGGTEECMGRPSYGEVESRLARHLRIILKFQQAASIPFRHQNYIVSGHFCHYQSRFPTMISHYKHSLEI